MGQPVTVLQKPTPRHDVVRFEINRSLTGMAGRRYEAGEEIVGPRPPDELARRLFAHGGAEAVHVTSNEITVHLAVGGTADGMAEVIEELFTYYREGVEPEPVS